MEPPVMVVRSAVIEPSSAKNVEVQSLLKLTAHGLLALLLALPIAALIGLVNNTFSSRPEKVVLINGVMLAILFAIPPGIHFARHRGRVDPYRMGFIVVSTMSVLLVSVYLYWVSFYVRLPADVLIWSEGDFVNDILKFRIGYPLFTAQANNESFHYPPGAQLLTYILASLSGQGTSIPALRVIQIVFTLLAATVSACCCRKLLLLSRPAGTIESGSPWGAMWVPVFFLMATNSIANPFVHNLHNDALSLLISATAYWLLLEYVHNRNKLVLGLMALIPAVGFFVKQSLAIWAVFYLAHLVLFDRPRSSRRVILFAVGAFGLIGTVIGVCYLIWSDPFVYWVFTVLANHAVSPLRSFKHLLDVWPYLLAGLLGGYALVRGKSSHLLLSPWLIWLALILLEAYTSGVAWMLNHIGPGCLIGGIWFMAGLARRWPRDVSYLVATVRAQTWFRVGIAVATLVLLFNGLGLVRIPLRPIPQDAYRYLSEIEREFRNQPPESTLLDVGTWVYLKEGVVMKDRAVTIGERGYSGTGDFSGILERLERKHYSKILVRNLHAPDFWYDHYLFSKPSNIRQAMLDNYHEQGKIPAVAWIDEGSRPYGFGEVTILVPNAN